MLVVLSVLQGAALILAMSVPLVAIGLWWNANTVAHNFIHRPFFRSRLANRLYAVFLTLVLGVPQSMWRERHLAHHADRPVRIRWGGPARVEIAVLLAGWVVAGTLAPAMFLTVYLPGWAIGLALCALQGHYEHAGGATSHYGRLYNVLFFNDGYHVEHHARPGCHWSELRAARADLRSSRWPPVLRWLDVASLDGLEHLVAKMPILQRFVVTRHERAFARLMPVIGPVRRVIIVGGGLFPRTALVLRRLMPHAELIVVDANAAHLALAGPRLDARVRVIHASYDPSQHSDADLVVVPLAFRGDRQQLYEHPPASRLVIHDWIWARRSVGTTVSWLLLKRMNLVVR